MISSGGNRTAKKTTRGWELCVEWKDGTSNWVKLKDLKDSNPVELAEYAVANAVRTESAVGIVHDLLRHDGEGKDLKTTAKQPLPTSYKPETNVSQDRISRYLQLIGMLRWAIELGRIDIDLEVAMMAPYSASPELGILRLCTIFSVI